MPDDLYRAYFELAARLTQAEAEADLERLIAVLRTHAPDLLPLYHRPAKGLPGGHVPLRKDLA